MLPCLLCGQDTPCFAESSVVTSQECGEAVTPPSGSWLLHSELLTPGACPGDSVPEAVHSAP